MITVLKFLKMIKTVVNNHDFNFMVKIIVTNYDFNYNKKFITIVTNYVFGDVTRKHYFTIFFFFWKMIILG